jgi:hypothetical protein
MPRLACGRRGRKAAERERERGGTVLQRCVGTATSVSLVNVGLHVNICILYCNTLLYRMNTIFKKSNKKNLKMYIINICEKNLKPFEKNRRKLQHRLS